MNNTMTFLDVFAGIGGFRLGMESVGFKCVGHIENDKFAQQSYNAIHNTKGEFSGGDITKITDEEFRKLRGSVDIIVGGFPCQAFSISGLRRGFEDVRGTMFFEIARAIKQIEPRYFILENVKGLLWRYSNIKKVCKKKCIRYVKYINNHDICIDCKRAIAIERLSMRSKKSLYNHSYIIRLSRSVVRGEGKIQLKKMIKEQRYE